MAERIASLYAEITADTSELQAGLNAASGAMGQSAADMEALGAASNALEATENRLAQAMFEAGTASQNLQQALAALNSNTDPEKQRELEGAVVDARVALDDANKSVGQYTQKISEMYAPQQAVTQATEESSFSFTEFSSALGLAKQGLEILKGAYQATIATTLAYGDEVRNLSRTIGASAEDASRLIQAADDVQVSQSALTAGLQAAIRNGLSPTIDGLGKLAEKYNSIQDPIARAKFLMDNFGRSGADLAPLLEKGADGIRKMGEEADATGQTLSGPVLEAQRNYEKSVDELGDHWEGFTTKLSTKWIPILKDAADQLNEMATFHEVEDKAIREGAIDLDQWGKKSVEMINAGATLADRIDYLNRKISENKDSFDRATGTIVNNTTALNNNSAAAAESARWAGVAAEAQNKQAESQQDAGFAAQNFAAGLSGPVGEATKAYAQTQTDLADDLAKTQAELDKYQKLQGQTVTVTTEAKASTLDLANAQFDAETAANRVADAQKKLNENTDPTKARELQGALLDAQVAAEGAAEKVGKLNDQMGGSKTVTLDYGDKIDKLKGHLADLQGQADSAAERMHALTNEFIFQQVSATLPADAALDLAHNMGLVDDASYAVSKSLTDLQDQYDTNNDGVITAAEGAGAYAEKIRDIGAAVAALQDKHITITVDTIYNEIAGQQYANANHNPDEYVPINPGGGKTKNPVNKQMAFGDSDFVVPPGFPNDSYRIGLSTGEHVSVTPDGKGNGQNSPIIGTVIVRDNNDIELLAQRVAALMS